jgi:HEPN domain
MGLPKPAEAQRFYRAAQHRLLDAQFLFSGERNTAAVYLAGYAVECMLKALHLSNLAPKARKDTMASFRGTRAHDFEWLKTKYFKSGGPRFPKDVVGAFSLVSTWDTDLRYQEFMVAPGEAEVFLKAAETILGWADGRF